MFHDSLPPIAAVTLKCLKICPFTSQAPFSATLSHFFLDILFLCVLCFCAVKYRFYSEDFPQSRTLSLEESCSHLILNVLRLILEVSLHACNCDLRNSASHFQLFLTLFCQLENASVCDLVPLKTWFIGSAALRLITEALTTLHFLLHSWQCHRDYFSVVVSIPAPSLHFLETDYHWVFL